MVNFLSVAINGLSAIVVSNPNSIAFILFCVNIGLMLCTVIQITALFVLCRKTSCASVVGTAAVLVLGWSVLLFFIQLFMYIYGNAYAIYAVSFCLCLTYAAFITSCVYSIMLSRNAHKTLCILTGLFDLIPPIGVVFTVILSYKINHDTPVQEYVYNGYAYTYAALGQFCARNNPTLIDMAGEEELEPLTKKQVKRKLKELKNKAVTAEGQYEYAVAIATYTPENSNKAVKFMKRAAEGGHASALFNMGYYHEIGAYVSKDYKKAKSYYTRAVEAGDEDAALRLGILEIKTNNATAGLMLFKERADKKDICAKYDMAVCYELGWGVEPDMDKALEIYDECIRLGMFAAQKRYFAIAATDINSPQNGSFFRQITERKFDGTFQIMINGLIEIKKRQAADAADYFLAAVKKGDKWEGFARCLVGTLYIDNGKELKDKCNGAEYIKSAMDKLPGAKDIFAVLPKHILKEIKAQNKANSKK